MRIRWLDTALICGAVVCGCSSSTPAADAGSGGLTSCVVADAGPHFVLDPKDGKCKVDGTTTNVGAACMGSMPAVCGTNQNASCLDSVIDDYPGGYCNVDPCSALDGHLCPIGASCAQLNGENGQCFKDCSSDSDCRMSEGYFCLDMTNDDHPGGLPPTAPTTSALWVSGASHKVCVRPQLTCPGSGRDCPSAIPRCVLPDGTMAFADGGAAGPQPTDGGAPPTPICVK